MNLSVFPCFHSCLIKCIVTISVLRTSKSQYYRQRFLLKVSRSDPRTLILPIGISAISFLSCSFFLARMRLIQIYFIRKIFKYCFLSLKFLSLLCCVSCSSFFINPSTFLCSFSLCSLHLVFFSK